MRCRKNSFKLKSVLEMEYHLNVHYNFVIDRVCNFMYKSRKAQFLYLEITYISCFLCLFSNQYHDKWIVVWKLMFYVSSYGKYFGWIQPQVCFLSQPSLINEICIPCAEVFACWTFIFHNARYNKSTISHNNNYCDLRMWFYLSRNTFCV